MTRWLLWMWEFKFELLTPAFKTAAAPAGGDPSPTRLPKYDRLMAIVKAPVNPALKPINFQTFDPAIFLAWIVNLRKEDGGVPDPNTLGAHRSAFFNLYRDFGETMPANMTSLLSQTFKGVKRPTRSRCSPAMARSRRARCHSPSRNTLRSRHSCSVTSPAWTP
jgi:hypothetical protein